jgi:hypothetical protein
MLDVIWYVGVRRGEPHRAEHQPQGDAVGHRLLEDSRTHVLLGHWTAPLFLLRLGVGILLGLGHHVKPHRHLDPLAARPRREDVDPFEHPILRSARNASKEYRSRRDTASPPSRRH